MAILLLFFLIVVILTIAFLIYGIRAFKQVRKYYKSLVEYEIPSFYADIDNEECDTECIKQ